MTRARLARAAVKITILVLLFLGVRLLLRGNETERRIRLLETEVRLVDWRILVDGYAGARHALPGVLEDALTLRGAAAPAGGMDFSRERGKQAVDGWNVPLRFVPGADGAAFAIRSAGPDGSWETEDDLSVEGTVGEDPAPIRAAARPKEEELARLRAIRERASRRR